MAGAPLTHQNPPDLATTVPAATAAAYRAELRRLDAALVTWRHANRVAPRRPRQQQQRAIGPVRMRAADPRLRIGARRGAPSPAHLRHRLHLTSEARPGRFPFQIQPSATHPKVLEADRRLGPRQSRCGRYPDGRPTAAGDDPGHGVRCLSPRLCAPNGDGHDRLGGHAVGNRLG